MLVLPHGAYPMAGATDSALGHAVLSQFRVRIDHPRRRVGFSGGKGFRARFLDQDWEAVRERILAEGASPADRGARYLRAVPDLSQIRAALRAREPKLIDEAEVRRAAVAMILREGSASRPETLFIERAKHPGDPWSGHMAFPGGRLDPGDPTLRDAAERETLEEVGLDLGEAELLGRLDDLEGRHAGRRTGLVISAFVYHHPGPGPLSPNYEVETAFWVPVRALRQSDNHVDYVHPIVTRPYPGIRVSEAEPHVVWGLTYRFVEMFLSAVGRPIPDRWEALQAELGEE